MIGNWIVDSQTTLTVNKFPLLPPEIRTEVTNSVIIRFKPTHLPSMEFWLLVIGGVTIIGVIGFAVASSRGSKRRRRDLERNTTITTSDIFASLEAGDNDQSMKDKQGRGGRRKEPILDTEPKHKAGPEKPDQAEPVQESDAETFGSQASRQGTLINDPEANADGGAPESNDSPLKQPRDERAGQVELQREHQVLVVYVMARGQGEFRCSGVSRVLTRAGCMLDERGVFQMRDDDQNERFGIVNAFEPATFEPDRMDVDTSRGLVFFMEARGRLDRQRFDGMLSLARKLALELDGELLDDKREPLSSVREHTYKADLVD